MSKIKIASVLLTIAFFQVLSIAQTPTIDWLKCYGSTVLEEGRSIVQTADGGFIIAGNQSNPSSSFDNPNVYIVKVNANGTVEWVELKGGSDFDFISDFKQTADGGFIMTGQTVSIDGDAIGNNGKMNTWIVKMDSLLNVEWQRTLKGQEENYGKSIEQTSDGGYILAGFTDGIRNGDFLQNVDNEDLYVVKLNSQGQTEWIKYYGGSFEDRIKKIQQTADGGYQILATTYSSDEDASGSNGGTDILIIKTDGNGNILWSKCIGGVKYDKSNSMSQTSDGGCIIIGSNYPPNSSAGIYVVKLNNIGDIDWERYFGGPDDNGNVIIQTTDGGYIYAGEKMNSSGTYHLRVEKLDANGNTQGQDTFTGTSTDSEAIDIIENQNGGYMLLANTTAYQIEGITTGYHYNGTGWWDILLVSMNQSVSFGEIIEAHVSIKPNPAKDLIAIQIDETLINTNYSIIDKSGKQVEDGKFNNLNHQINVEHLNDGMYFLTIDNSGFTYKIVKI